jgi:hypothetical protein
VRQHGLAHDVANGEDVRHVGAHLNVDVDEATVGNDDAVINVLFKVHLKDVVEQKNPCNLLPVCLRQRASARMVEDAG